MHPPAWGLLSLPMCTGTCYKRRAEGCLQIESATAGWEGQTRMQDLDLKKKKERKSKTKENVYKNKLLWLLSNACQGSSCN